MKNLTKIIVALIVIVSLSSCAAVQSPLMGSAFSKVSAPVTATGNEVGTKVGTASAISIAGIVAIGDASINKAAKEAGITKISHVDYSVVNIAGFYAEYKVYVYGE
ncbi:MAG: hypothetical protein CL843_06020 [Crocinitomicaceae bacterium]|nr:hypothetical protein [Crocinitomicaceae bacterium]|tara:strand:- start:1567 stop:1884 length:318 start_codon:yes stop_codon:yes gene_type:complete